MISITNFLNLKTHNELKNAKSSTNLVWKFVYFSKRLIMNLKLELRTKNFLIQQIQKSDFEGLFLAASDPEIWKLHPDRNRYQRDRFEVYFNSGLQAPAFYKILNSKNQEIVGSTRFYGYQALNNFIELGYTFLIKKYWGGLTNLEIKRALLDEAFQTVESVFFTVGNQNFRSQRAMEKIGGLKVEKPAELNLAGNLSAAVVYQIRKNQMAHINQLYNLKVQQS